MPPDALLWLEIRWNPAFNKCLTILGPYTNSPNDRLLLQFTCNRINLGVEQYPGAKPMPHGVFDFIMTDPEFHNRLQNFRDTAAAKEDRHVFHMNVAIERKETIAAALRNLPHALADMSVGNVRLHTARTLAVRLDYPFPIDDDWFDGKVEGRAEHQSPWIVTATRTFMDLDEAKEHALKMLADGKEDDTDKAYQLKFIEGSFEFLPGWWLGRVMSEGNRWKMIVAVETQAATHATRHVKHW